MSRGRMRLQTDENWLDMHAERWRGAEPDQSTGRVALQRAPVRHGGDSDAPGRLRAEGKPCLEEAIGRQACGRWQQEAKLASGD